jgi:hypothetical protein
MIHTTRAFQLATQQSSRIFGRSNPCNLTALKLSSTIPSNENSGNSENVPSEKTIIWNTRDKCWRPTVQDVERISWGKPAKKKGTGSRGVPHRLNHEEERKLFDQARRKGFLEVNGSGWRTQRRDAPLINTYRSLCDARGQVCIVLHKGNTGLDDELIIDLSPLRLPETFETLGKDIINFVNVPAESNFEREGIENLGDNQDGHDVQTASNDEEEVDNNLLAWEERPIYQLNPFCISWKIERSEGKSLGKKLATVFKTAEPMASASKKPNHVKPGKNRRSGGYGIG